MKMITHRGAVGKVGLPGCEAALPCKRSPGLLESSSLPPLVPLTQSKTSWYMHLPGFLKPYDRSTFQRTWVRHPGHFHPIKVFGRDTFENRYSQLYVTDESVGDAYRYSGTSKTSVVCNPECDEERFVSDICGMADQILRLLAEAGHTKIPEDVKEKGMPTGGTENDNDGQPSTDSRRIYNCCLTNWYEPDHSIGLHADDEMRMDNRYPILSLSWGGPRRFLLRPKKDTTDFANKVTEVLLRDGDLFIMGGRCQEEFKHEIPKMRKKDGLGGNRISWTIRRMVAKDESTQTNRKRKADVVS